MKTKKVEINRVQYPFIQWVGDNKQEVDDFIQSSVKFEEYGFVEDDNILFIVTKANRLTVNKGDYVVAGQNSVNIYSAREFKLLVKKGENKIIENENPVELKECDCMDKTKQLIIDRAIADGKNTEGYKIIEADWEYKSWYPKVRLYVNFIIKYTFTKKDGSTSKPKNSHASIFFSYCPFCGKKYPVMPKYDLVEVKPEEKK